VILDGGRIDTRVHLNIDARPGLSRVMAFPRPDRAINQATRGNEMALIGGQVELVPTKARAGP